MKFSCMDIMYQEISLTLFIVGVVIMDLQRLLLFNVPIATFQFPNGVKIELC